MPLNANALVTVADAKTYLQIAGAAQDALVEDIINRVSTTAERICNRPLKEQAFSALRVHGPNAAELYPPAIPINVGQAVTITVDGIAQTVWRTEADGDPALKDVVVGADIWDPILRPNLFYRHSGWARTSSLNPFSILLSYTGGLATIPDDLREAAFLMAQKFFREQQKGMAEVTTVTTPGGAVTLLDTTIPRRAATILDYYRRRGMA